MFLKNVIKKNSGFSLPELMLAVAILAFVLTGMLLLFINCIIINSTSRYLTIATSHAEFVMEDIRNSTTTSANFNSTRDDIINNNPNNWDWDTATINNKGLVALSGENIDTSGTVINSTLLGDLLKITVTVNWQDRAAVERNTTLETFIATP